MDLSNNLISQFVKMTNDDNRVKSKESTVYGTTVEYDNLMYVKIDGSDLLTPINTTTDIQAGERVTVMIKDHTATVTGNITSPSANVVTVDKKVTAATDGMAEDIEGKVMVEVGVLVSDKVSTGQLDAEVARIEDLTVENLKATNAEIENLKVKNAEIENLTVENFKAVNAEIGTLDAELADIETLVNGNLTSDNILSFHITADKVTMDDAFISDAMIANITAGKITAGSINTGLVNIQSEDGSLIINGSTQQFKDADGNVRIQIGKDAKGDFTFALYGADGQGQLINQNGITASGIGDGLIVNDMIKDDAAISGGKLDISSVITEINDNNDTTIKSSKVFLDGQSQSLEVAFNSLKTQVDTIQDVTIDGDLTSIVEQVQSNTTEINVNKDNINTLVAENIVRKEEITDLNGDMQKMNNTLSSQYTSMEQDLNGFKTSVANTYATKSTVKDLSDNLTTNYSTTATMNSAINQKANEINTSVSSTYVSKTEFDGLEQDIESKYASKSELSQTTDNITATFTKSGGYNLIENSSAALGVERWYTTATIFDSQSSDAIKSAYSAGKCFRLGTVAPPVDPTIPVDPAAPVEPTVPTDVHAYSYRFLLKPSTTYTLSGVCSANEYCKEMRISILFSNSINEAGNISITSYNIDEPAYTLGTNSWWKRFSFTITTDANCKSGVIRISNLGTNNVNNQADVWFGDLLLEEGAVAHPWSPHPNECYSGVISMNADGVKVSHSDMGGFTTMSAHGFYVNDGKEDVISATNKGLHIKGNITVTGGIISGSTSIDGNGIQPGTITAEKLVLEGASTTGENGRNVTIENANYTVSENGGNRMFMGFKNMGVSSYDIYGVPKIAMGAYGYTSNHNYFTIVTYKGTDNPQAVSTAYVDLAYHCISNDDYSNIKMYDGGNIRIAPLQNLEITTNHLNGAYEGTGEKRLALFATSSTSFYNSNLQIGAVANHSNSGGLILADRFRDSTWSEAGGENLGTSYATVIRIQTDSAYDKYVRPFDTKGDINLGSGNYRWKKVYSIEADSVSSDARLKENIVYLSSSPKARIASDYTIQDMYEFVKYDLKLATYNYIVGDGDTKIGFIAQDVKDTKMGSLIVEENQETRDVDAYLSYDVMNYTNVLAGALQMAVNKIETLEEEIQNLKGNN